MIKYAFFLVILIGLILRMSTFTILQKNLLSISYNKALGLALLNYSERKELIENALYMAKKLNVNGHPHIVSDLEQELAFRENALNYLKSNRLDNFELGVQILINPNFSHGGAGWTQYNSDWEFNRSTNFNDMSATYTHKEISPSSISQTLILKSNKCYLFSILGKVKRYDEVPTYWGYWEVYEENIPFGKSLIRANGNQPWSERFGIICLDHTGEITERKVTVAPVNLYGSATVWLDRVSLYELRDIK